MRNIAAKKGNYTQEKRGDMTVIDAVLDVLAKHGRGSPYRQTTSENLAETLDHILKADLQTTLELQDLKHAIINYLDNRPDDEQGTRKEWAAFRAIARTLEVRLGVEEGRWG